MRAKFVQQNGILVGAFLGAGIVASAAMSGPASANEDTMQDIIRTGDALQIGLPLAAFGLTYLFDAPEAADSVAWRSSPGELTGPAAFDGLSLNGSARHDLLVALLRTEVVTHSLKFSVNAERPNGASQSFPSGHTAAAFTGAEFIRKQYGWAMGSVAYASAAYVGWSRVVSSHHWARDVYAGAAIGILSNYDINRWELPFGRLTVMPGLRPVALGVGAGPELGVPSFVSTVQIRLEF